MSIVYTQSTSETDAATIDTIYTTNTRTPGPTNSRIPKDDIEIIIIVICVIAVVALVILMYALIKKFR